MFPKINVKFNDSSHTTETNGFPVFASWWETGSKPSTVTVMYMEPCASYARKFLIAETVRVFDDWTGSHSIPVFFAKLQQRLMVCVLTKQLYFWSDSWCLSANQMYVPK